MMSVREHLPHRAKESKQDRKIVGEDGRKMEKIRAKKEGNDWMRYGLERGERTDEVICSCLAISYEACARLAYAYAWAAEILAQPLVMLEEAAELEF